MEMFLSLVTVSFFSIWPHWKINLCSAVISSSMLPPLFLATLENSPSTRPSVRKFFFNSNDVHQLRF